MGGFGNTLQRFWERLRAGGVKVRCYNPSRFDSPLGWLSRDHRKMLAIDGQIGFITGLCVGSNKPDRTCLWQFSKRSIRRKNVEDGFCRCRGARTISKKVSPTAVTMNSRVQMFDVDENKSMVFN